MIRPIEEGGRILLFEWGGIFKSNNAAHNYATYRANQTGLDYYVIKYIEKVEG